MLTLKRKGKGGGSLCRAMLICSAIAGCTLAGMAWSHPARAKGDDSQAAALPSPLAPNGKPTTEMQLVDARDKKEDHQAILSVAVRKCDYFIIRLSDKGMSRSRLNIVRSALAEKLGTGRLPGPITINHLAIYLNDGSVMKTAALNAPAAMLGGVFSKPGMPHAVCERDKTPYGWFAPEEVTTSHPPLVGEMVATVRGTQYNVRVVVSPENKNFNENSSKPEWGAQKEAIFQGLAAKLAGEIGATTQ